MFVGVTCDCSSFVVTTFMRALGLACENDFYAVRHVPNILWMRTCQLWLDLLLGCWLWQYVYVARSRSPGPWVPCPLMWTVW
jgi:hypothetical protein